MVPAPTSVTAPADLAVVECADSQVWDAFVLGRPEAHGAHRFAWKDILERSFGHRSRYLLAHRRGIPHGVLPLIEFRSWLFGRFAVSLPFLNYGGVLADDPAAAAALVAHALTLAREGRWKHVELRHLQAHCPEWPSRRHKVAMWRVLPDSEDGLWASIDRKARNLVRKSEREGCVALRGGRELLDDYYHVFSRNMRDLGTPVYPRRLFDHTVDVLGADARVYVVRSGPGPVAAAITLDWRDQVEVPWASSLREHNHRSPNMLLYWTMLRDAVARGRRLFDFGRSTPDEGTFHFKRQWRAEPHPMVWEYPGESGELPDRGPTNPRFRAAIALWKNLPMSAANRLGPRIVRNIP